MRRQCVGRNDSGRCPTSGRTARGKASGVPGAARCGCRRSRRGCGRGRTIGGSCRRDGGRGRRARGRTLRAGGSRPSRRGRTRRDRGRDLVREGRCRKRRRRRRSFYLARRIAADGAGRRAVGGCGNPDGLVAGADGVVERADGLDRRTEVPRSRGVGRVERRDGADRDGDDTSRTRDLPRRQPAAVALRSGQRRSDHVRRPERSDGDETRGMAPFASLRATGASPVCPARSGSSNEKGAPVLAGVARLHPSSCTLVDLHGSPPGECS